MCPRPPRSLVGLWSALTLALAVSTLFVVPGDLLTHTAYAGASPLVELAEAAAALALVGATLVAWLLRPDRAGLRVALGLVALTWLAPRWVGWEDGPAVVRSLAMLVAPFLVPAVAHVVVAAQRDVRGQVVGRLVVALYAWTAVVSLVSALVRDPFLDLRCWDNCSDNVFLVHAWPDLARGLGTSWAVTELTVGVSLVGYGVARLTGGTRVARRGSWPVRLSGVLTGGALAAYGLAWLRQPVEAPDDPVFATVHLLLALGLLALAGAATRSVVRAHQARRAIAELAADLGAAPAPGSLRDRLARGTADPGLVVGYPAPDGAGYVDAAGAAMEATGPGRVATSIVRNGEEVAVVVHDAATVDAEMLRTELGPAARLAVENERLQARLLAELAALTASRARIVERGDAERRRLERNLHDGAQQQLLALLYQVQLALAAADAQGQPGLVPVLEGTRDHVREAIVDLRELAHGIYPAVLTESGLGAALWTLTDEADLPVALEVDPEQRHPQAVERAAFVVVRDALDAGPTSAVGPLRVRVLAPADDLVVEVTGLGTVNLPSLVDRLGAIGGELRADGQVLRAVIPRRFPQGPDQD